MVNHLEQPSSAHFTPASSPDASGEAPNCECRSDLLHPYGGVLRNLLLPPPIAAERKRREIDPTLRNLRECAEEAGNANGPGDAYAKDQLEDLLGFFELVSDSYEKTNKMPTKTAVKALKMSDKLFKLLGVKV